MSAGLNGATPTPGRPSPAAPRSSRPVRPGRRPNHPIVNTALDVGGETATIATVATLRGAFTISGRRGHDPADRVFAIGRTSCSGSPEYAIERAERSTALLLLYPWILARREDNIRQLGLHDAAVISGYRRVAEAVRVLGVLLEAEIQFARPETSSTIEEDRYA